MAQEFFIKSENLETQVRKLLPSQGGLGAGFDLSASTQIIPIIDLTESAEGSVLRSDLQQSFGFETSFIAGTGSSGTQTVINNTGYYRVLMNYGIFADGGANNITLQINNGFSTKPIFTAQVPNGNTGGFMNNDLEIVVFLSAGNSLEVTSAGAADTRYNISSKQIADIDGNLSNPT